MKKFIFLPISLLILAVGTPAMATTFVAEWVAPSGVGGLNKPAGPTAPALVPGLHVTVLDGMIQVSNLGGSMNFSAGQFGYTRNSTTLPVVVPANPGIKFAPPPAFSNYSMSPSSTANTASGPSNSIDCEVR